MQNEEEQKQHQESEAARLADLERLLKVLAAKTEVCVPLIDILFFTFHSCKCSCRQTAKVAAINKGADN